MNLVLSESEFKSHSTILNSLVCDPNPVISTINSTPLVQARYGRCMQIFPCILSDANKSLTRILILHPQFIPFLLLFSLLSSSFLYLFAIVIFITYRRNGTFRISGIRGPRQPSGQPMVNLLLILVSSQYIQLSDVWQILRIS